MNTETTTHRPNLFEIVDQYHADLAKLSELDLPPEAVMDTMEAMQGDVETKVRAVVAFAMQLDKDAEARREQAKRMTEGARAMENRAEALRTYAQVGLMNSGLKLPLRAPEFTLNLAKLPPSVTILNPEDVPNEYRSLEVSASGRLPEDDKKLSEALDTLRELGLEVLVTADPVKKLVADAVKAGNTVPGAKLDPVAYRLSVR